MAKRVLLHAIFTMGNDQGKGIKFGFVFLSFNVSNEIFAKDGEFFFWWGGGGRKGVYSNIMLGWAFEPSY
jgi:hypothetical protein